jgi:hypothetical protein
MQTVINRYVWPITRHDLGSTQRRTITGASQAVVVSRYTLLSIELGLHVGTNLGTL